MFKKKPQIKNLSPLRSSDRRRLADQIIADYRIAIPTTPTDSAPPHPDGDKPAQPPLTVHPAEQHAAAAAASASASASASAASSSAPSSLARIRSQLLPDSTASAKFTTTSGANSAPVSGTVYVGAHPGEEARVLWIQYGKEPRLVPTVYTLWRNPGIVPLLHTPDFVAEEKLRQGADFMIPGLFKAKGSEWDPRAVKGSVVAVAGITRDTVPVWVGTCEVDVSRFGDDYRAQKGVAAKGLHWEGDEIWNWSTVAGAGGRPSPAAVDGWAGMSAALEQDMANVTLEEKEEADEKAEGDEGGAKLYDNPGQADLGEQLIQSGQPDVEEETPTTADIDKAFHQAFLFSLCKAKQTNKPPHYGFDFPIQPSFLIANMVQPHLRRQSPHYHIKKTSWKNAKKYIKHLDKAGLAKSKDRNGGETVILAIDFDDPQVNTFVPYKLPSPKPTTTTTTTTTTPPSFGPSTETPSITDPSKGQILTTKTLYRAGPKLVPTLLPSKTDFYTAAQITAAVKSYIDARPELGGHSASSIALDAFLANTILGSASPAHAQEDARVLALGRISRAALQQRLLADSRLCAPYHTIERSSSNNPAAAAATTEPPKPRPGHPPRVSVVVEKRTGTKVVTRLAGLEPFGVNPHLLAPELQRRCAGACTVGQLQGGKTGLLEVVVQGDQSKVLTGDVLPKRGVLAKWVDVVDKTKGKKK